MRKPSTIWIGVTKHGTLVRGCKYIRALVERGILHDFDRISPNQLDNRIAIPWLGDWVIARPSDAQLAGIPRHLWRWWRKD